MTEREQTAARQQTPKVAEDSAPGERTLERLEDVLSLLRVRLELDFAPYRRPPLLRRVRDRAERIGLLPATLPDEAGPEDGAWLVEYAELLRRDEQELRSLAKHLRLPVTGFFRDPEAWEALEAPLRRLVEELSPGEPLRLWVPACATGQEAYSLAILAVEAMESTGRALDLELFATDADEGSVSTARRGLYPESDLEEIPTGRRERFFGRRNGLATVAAGLRDRIVFAVHDLVADPPFSRMHLVSCRNLLVYLRPEARQRVIGLLHFSLRADGLLFLGTSEGVGDREGLFRPVAKRWRIFRRLGAGRASGFELPAVWPERLSPARPPHREKREVPPAPPEVQVRTLLLDHFSPPAVLVDRELRILWFHGSTGRYLEMPGGETGQDLLAMAGERLRPPLERALREASRGHGSADADTWLERNGAMHRVRVAVRPVSAPEADGARFLVAFEELPWPRAARLAGEGREGEDLERTLGETRHDLRTAVDQLERSNEELQATNEELRSANDELQTSQEELRSLNEELRVVNMELESRVEELREARDDLRNLLGSSDVATLFLDPDLRIRMFTPRAVGLFGLLERDVGRPLGDLEPRFRDPALMADARAACTQPDPREAEVEDAQGRWYLRRALPYRTAGGEVDGVVVTFHEVTQLKRAEAELEERVRERTAHLRLLRDVTTIANTVADEEEAMRRALERISEHNGWVAGHLDRIAEGGRIEPGAIWFVAEGWEDAAAELRAVYTRPPGERGGGLPARAAVAGEARWLMEGEELDDPRLAVLARTGLEGAVAFPVLVGAEVAAVIEFFARHRTEPTAELQEAMSSIGVQLGRVLERAAARRRLAELALEEQRRIGEELHEGLGQQITGLAMMARSMRRRLETDGDAAAAEQAREIEQGVESSRELVRRLAKGLVALQLEDRSLVEALEEMASDLCELHGVTCRLELAGEVTVDDVRTATCLYRIAREAVNNALLHAQAEEVVIRLVLRDGGVVLEVEDDGKGMAEGYRRSGGLGLRIMEERARMADGELEIDSLPGEGTRVRCTIPEVRDG